MSPVLPVTALAEGEMTLCRVSGRDVLVCQVHGQYYALDSVCPHAGQPLIGGRLDGHRLYCPLHRASFDIRSGSALSAPASDPLQTFPVQISGGKVHVEIS